jgi:tetratricopeptide (TPR) repeat protein
MVVLALEAGTVVRVLVIVSGTKVASPPPPLLIPGADNIAWAWAIFFVVLAIVYLTDAGPVRSERFEPEPVGDYVEPEPEPEVLVAAPSEAMPDEPTVEGGDALPVVPNVPESQAWLEKGSELHVSGHYDQAIAHFDKALVLHPRLAGAWAGKELASNALGQYQEAIRCYDEARPARPGSLARQG